MKKIILIALISLYFGEIDAQIADVKQRGSQLVVYGKNGLYQALILYSPNFI